MIEVVNRQRGRKDRDGTMGESYEDNARCDG